MPIRLYVVDWSGTASNDKSQTGESNIRLLVEYGKPCISLEEWATITANSPAGNTVEFLEGQQIHADPTEVLRKHRAYLREIKRVNPPKLYPDVKETVESLHRQGMMFAVLSTHPEIDLRSEATEYGISNFFWKIVGSSEQKPVVNKAYELKVLCQLAEGLYDIHREEVRYVADMLPDRLAAEKADVRFIGVSYGYHPREMIVPEGSQLPIIDSFSELQTRLSSL